MKKTLYELNEGRNVLKKLLKNIIPAILIAVVLLTASITVAKAQPSGQVIVVFPPGTPTTTYANSNYEETPTTYYYSSSAPPDPPSVQSGDPIPGVVTLPLLPGNTEGYYLVQVYGSFLGFATVYVPYDPADFHAKYPHLYIGDPVDFNNDGKVGLDDVALMRQAIREFRSGTLSHADLEKYDLNHDGVINNADLLIVLEFACFGIHANGATLPWMDVTVGTYYDPSTNTHYVVGITDHFSVFGVH